MPELRLGVALSSFGQPFKKALHTAASLGARGIEIDARNDLRPNEISDTGRRQLRKLLADLNLRVAGVRFSTRRGYDATDNLDRRMQATVEAMRFAYSLGANVIVNSVGRIPESSDHPAYVQLQACLSDLARHGARIGAMLAAETGTEPLPVLTKLLDSIPERAIGICLNPGNLIINDHYSEDDIGICAERILHVYARDGVRDVARGKGVDVPLGRGSAEFPTILGALDQHHYNGWFVIDRMGSLDPIQETRTSLSFLQNL
ncbi:MAG: sugar phosphate isomerase/epimerase [Planctomycetales bacterium]|nr:sugar phosphate isomerase/epimerase [Planctomycetales bacterium]